MCVVFGTIASIHRCRIYPTPLYVCLSRHRRRPSNTFPQFAKITNVYYTRYMELSTHSRKPFRVALVEAARAIRGDELGEWSRSAFYDEVAAEIGYATVTISACATGTRHPTKQIMEGMARVLGIAPEYFREYRLLQIVQAFKKFPDLEEAFYDQIMTLAEVKTKSSSSRV